MNSGGVFQNLPPQKFAKSMNQFPWLWGVKQAWDLQRDSVRILRLTDADLRQRIHWAWSGVIRGKSALWMHVSFYSHGPRLSYESVLQVKEIDNLADIRGAFREALTPSQKALHPAHVDFLAEVEQSPTGGDLVSVIRPPRSAATFNGSGSEFLIIPSLWSR